MTSRPFAAVALLSIILSALAGCGFRSTPTDPAAVAAQFEAAKRDELQLVRELVENPDRVDTLTLLIERRDQTVAAYANTVNAYLDKTRALNADYDATRLEFEQLITGYQAARQSYQGELANIIEQMKAATTAKEWKQLAKFQLKTRNPRAMMQSTGGA